MDRKKKENKAEVYYLKVPTFRRTVELHIGWDKEYFDKMFWEYWYDYNLTTGFFCFDDKNNCNIMWLKDYSISTLVHELFHCVIGILDQIWEDRANWEAPAYIYEELFTKIWIKCWNKFKMDKDVIKYIEQKEII
jgi:hypothetical protein